MKVITCASYYATGSSAIVDLISEYKCVQTIPNYEFRIFHDTDGISDLEFHLCQCHNRHNSGVALKRFERLANFYSGSFLVRRYEQFFNGQFKNITKQYISALKDFEYKGWIFYDLYDNGRIPYFAFQIINHLLQKIHNGKLSVLPNNYIYCSHPTEESFLAETRKYTSALFKALNTKNKDYLSIEQIVPTQNVNRILRYFDEDVYVIRVKRDPRSVYASSKFVYSKNQEHVCPYYDVNLFCDWYKYTLESGSVNSCSQKNVLEVWFEDLIYKYDDTVKRIEEYTGLKSSEHVDKFKHFNPKRSIVNAKSFENYEISDDINVIEKKLGEYLYPFNRVENNIILGKEVCDKTLF